jgi:hypothetical protein
VIALQAAFSERGNFAATSSRHLIRSCVPLQFLAESNDHVLGSHFVRFNVLRSQEPARKGKEETRAAQRSADSQPAKNECAREEARTCFPTHAQPQRNAPAGVFSSPATSPCTTRGAHSHTSFVCAETSLFYSRASPRTRLTRVVEKPHNFDPTGGRKILLDFVVEKSQKFDAGHRAVHAVPQEHWRLENLCARTNPLYYERQLSIATSRFRKAPPTVLVIYYRPRKLCRLCRHL